MANEQNLIPQAHKLTVEEQSKGGIASGKARRANATFKEIINSILNEDGGTYKGEAVTKKQIIGVKALKYLLEENDLDAREFARMFELVRDTIGEKPIDKVQLSEIDQSVMDEVEAMIAEAEEEPAHYDREAEEGV